ncbi:hypothetical protein ACUY4R_001726 [Kosakonia sp. BK9b]
MQCEQQLHRLETRRRDDILSKILHREFFEIGRSGKRYDRQQVIDALIAEDNDQYIHSTDFALSELSATSVLLTYRSFRVDERGDIFSQTWRTSLWVKSDDDVWQMRFHQGTPVGALINRLLHMVTSRLMATEHRIVRQSTLVRIMYIMLNGISECAVSLSLHGLASRSADFPVSAPTPFGLILPLSLQLSCGKALRFYCGPAAPGLAKYVCKGSLFPEPRLFREAGAVRLPRLFRCKSICDSVAISMRLSRLPARRATTHWLAMLIYPCTN